MIYRALFILSLFWLVPLADAAERLRIVEAVVSDRLPADQPQPPKVIIDLTGRTQAERDLIAKLWTDYGAALSYAPNGSHDFLRPGGGISIRLEHDGHSVVVASSYPLLERGGSDLHLQDRPQGFQQFIAAFDTVLAAAQAFKHPAK